MTWPNNLPPLVRMHLRWSIACEKVAEAVAELERYTDKLQDAATAMRLFYEALKDVFPEEGA